MDRDGEAEAELVVTEEEREELISLTRRHRTAQAIALRARIILSCSAGLDNKAVAAVLSVSQPTVGKWRARFIEERVAGLYDEPKPWGTSPDLPRQDRGGRGRDAR